MSGMALTPVEDSRALGARTYIGLFFFVLVAHALWYAAANPPPGFADSDGYMRVLRVEMLWQGGGWFDNSIARANAPYGGTLHWTRPLDVLISLLAVPLAPVFGTKAAIFWGGALSGPLLHAAAAAVLAWAALPLVGRTAAILAGIAATVQYGLIAYGSLARADHHVFYVLLAALGFGYAVRALAGERFPDRSAFYAGLAAAGGVWIGVEGLTFAALVFAVFGLAWVSGADDPGATRCFRYAFGFTLGLAAMLAIERGPSFPEVAYDQISIVHATLGALIAAFFAGARWLSARGMMRTPIARAISAAIGAGSSLGLWLVLFPKVVHGPLADVDSQHIRLILDNISELGPGFTLERFPATLGATVLAAPWLAWRVWRERASSRFWIWLLAGLCVVVFGLLTAGWVRWVTYAGLFPCLALGDMIARASERIAMFDITPARREALTAATVMPLLLGPQSIAYLAMLATELPDAKHKREEAKTCRGELLADALNRPPWSDKPRVVLIGVNYGAEILWRTPHRVLGAPYHRMVEGVHDTFEAFAANDEATARTIVERRGIDLIAICPAGGEGLIRRDGDFYERLKTGSPPAWVREVSRAGEGAFRLFEVRREEFGR